MALTIPGGDVFKNSAQTFTQTNTFNNAAAGGGNAITVFALSPTPGAVGLLISGVDTTEKFLVIDGGVGGGTNLVTLTNSTLTINAAIAATAGIGAGNQDISAVARLIYQSQAAPTLSAVGQTAFDNNIWAASRGSIVFHDGTAAVVVVAALASDAPSNGQVPTWNTGGTVTWETPSAAPGGTSTQIQFNDNGALGGIPELTWDAGVDTLNCANNINVVGIYAVGAVQVVGPQQAPIADATEDTASNTTTINAILGALRTHGLIDT